MLNRLVTLDGNIYIYIYKYIWLSEGTVEIVYM